MTRQKLPDVCNFCGKDIDSEMQYVSEWFQGRSSFGEKRVRLKEKLDACHKCFLEICENGLKPTWIKEQKNPQYVKGSTVAEEKPYWLLIENEVIAK